MRRASRRPNFIILEQIFVEECLDWLDMPHRRNSPDDETSALAHEISVGLADLLPQDRGKGLFVHAVDAAGDHQNRAIRLLCAENERFGNLSYRATNRLRCIGCGAGAVGQLHDLQDQAESIQGSLNALSAGTEFGLDTRFVLSSF